MIYDLIIVGMGPAGVSAAIYAKRAGLNILCIEKNMVGGYLNFIDRIDNYPGFYEITGPDLAFEFLNQVKKTGIDVKKAKVLDIKNGDVKKVITDKGEFESKYVVLATGRVSRELGLEHENELIGRGISHCALCDGTLYKDKEVAVVGGGNAAIQETLYLASICKKVYLIHRRDKFTAQEELLNKLDKLDNIEKIMNSKIDKLNVTDDVRLDSVVLDSGRVINVPCLFTYIGYVPGTKLSLDIMDESGYVQVDNYCESSEDGIYAVGDIIKKELYQIVTATSEGAVAATKIVERCK
jgi:thioredoxin reductase (NADPH)